MSSRVNNIRLCKGTRSVDVAQGSRKQTYAHDDGRLGGVGKNGHAAIVRNSVDPTQFYVDPMSCESSEDFMRRKE